MPPGHAPEPARTLFDPFNPSSTGHQRGENCLSGSTSWRDSRTQKLAYQLCDASGGGGKSHVTDLVGAGSESHGRDGRKENGCWGIGAPGLREKGWQDIRGLLGVNKKRKSEEKAEKPDGEWKMRRSGSRNGSHVPIVRTQSSLSSSQLSPKQPLQLLGQGANPVPESTPKSISQAPQIFRCLALYLNGSTHASGISDHKLKHLFVQHGGSLSIALGRRTVTHVILGSRGGGLAAGKIQKEVTTLGGKGVRYVTAEWVVDSVECGKRLPESKYQAVHTAMKGQGSMLGKLGGKQQQQGENNKEMLSAYNIMKHENIATVHEAR